MDQMNEQQVQIASPEELEIAKNAKMLLEQIFFNAPPEVIESITKEINRSFPNA